MLRQFTGSSYALPENVFSERLQLEREESHHLLHVLRKHPGDMFLATDGMGMTYECEFVTVDGDRVQGRILRSNSGRGELSFDIVLCLALLKRDKFEWVVEKATELGVSQFRPFVTSRTVVRETSFRRERYLRIAVAAMKQSCRSRLPAIEPPQSFTQMLDAAQSCDARVLAHERAGFDRSLLTFVDDIKGKQSIAVCIGPEGGFSESEVEEARSRGFATVSLGRRRLRSETAAIAAVSAIASLREQG